MKKILLTALGLSTIILTGCGQQASQNTEAKTVKIGVIAPVGGALAGYGEDTVNVYNDELAAFQKANPEQKIEMIVEDGKCDGKDATSAAQKLINVDKVDIILGGLCSAETIAAGKIAQENKTVELSPLSSAPSISDIGDYVYRFWSDAFAAIPVAKYTDSKMSKIALVVENTDFAQGFAKAYKANTKSTIVNEQAFNSEEKDFDILVKNIQALGDKVDGIMFSNQSDATAISFLTALDKNNLLGKFKGKIFIPVGINVKKTLETMKDKIEGLMTYGPADTTKDPVNQEYLKNFEAKYTVKGDRLYLLFSKDGIDLILEAIKAGNTTSDQIKAYFDNINENNKRHTSFGDFYFDKNGDGRGLNFSILDVQNNQAVQVQ